MFHTYACQTDIHEHLYKETDYNVREFGPKKVSKTPISDNLEDSTQKSNIDRWYLFSVEKSTEQIQF